MCWSAKKTFDSNNYRSLAAAYFRPQSELFCRCVAVSVAVKYGGNYGKIGDGYEYELVDEQWNSFAPLRDGETIRLNVKAGEVLWTLVLNAQSTYAITLL